MDLVRVKSYLEQKGEPPYRLKQIKEAFFQQALAGYQDISSLPQKLKEDLSANIPWLTIKPKKIFGSLEKEVVKARLSLADGFPLETVLMVYQGWISACLSVSSGCPLNCSFCATGKFGFKRNLEPFEIVDQVAFWNQYLKSKDKRVSRIVFMGMGEPFLNWKNTWEAIKTINDPEALNIGERHITVSTAGIISGIKDFTNLKTQINLAISLHSPFQAKRETIMPSAKQNSLSEIMRAAKEYVQKTNRKLFFEYALIDGFNDRPEDAAEIGKIFTEPLFHLNLINLNPTGAALEPTTPKQTKIFTNLLDKEKVPYTIRRSLGSEIQAACGQLAGTIRK